METHYIFLTYHTGMASVFPVIKERLANHAQVSLVYFSSNHCFYFRKELEILQCHFRSQLYISYESTYDENEGLLNQANIEAIINANTAPGMCFTISGDPIFSEKINRILLFLGIKNIIIQEQYFIA
ncbi:hypothetical protein SAMN04515674_11773 [Pseudarcicella hirudinis]|uniref:Uncharacterized protein n=1 Tax=Pseudarcicella hirudinis TaxID=1079859 RepID=A0A1I5Y8C0_9BACT|nr:hypothetical protein [Pseudarcicella hirudinis]SFQ40157.1 hypothetical protein SAMN04515674_11773 [Pseudarcicella hirudinis]